MRTFSDLCTSFEPPCRYRDFRPATAEAHSNPSRGCRPPAVSTHAANGILSNDPESDGIATRNPTCSGVSPRVCLMAAAGGAQQSTPPHTQKKQKAAPKKHN